MVPVRDNNIRDEWLLGIRERHCFAEGRLEDRNVLGTSFTSINESVRVSVTQDIGICTYWMLIDGIEVY